MRLIISTDAVERIKIDSLRLFLSSKKFPILASSLMLASGNLSKRAPAFLIIEIKIRRSLLSVFNEVIPMPLRKTSILLSLLYLINLFYYTN